MSDPLDTPREQLLAWLDAREPSAPVTTVETHISILAFQGDRVYKLKKAVRFAFIDLSTRERRLEDCEREVALNRRLAPDVYLGVEAVTGHDGDVVDHVVVMQRMPDGARLSSRVDGSDATTCIDALAKVMARFHAAAPTGGAIDAAATRDAVAALWDRELDEYPGPSPEIATAVRRYLAGREALFDARLAAGRARDGHGDLLADDVFCLPDGPRVLDCLEFDDRLRFGDVLADVAFLAMDLERLGRADLAARFLDRYREAAADAWPPSLEHFYIAYRAHVRAKVAAMSGDDAARGSGWRSRATTSTGADPARARGRGARNREDDDGAGDRRCDGLGPGAQRRGPQGPRRDRADERRGGAARRGALHARVERSDVRHALRRGA